MGEITKFPDIHKDTKKKEDYNQQLKDFLVKLYDTLDKHLGIPVEGSEDPLFCSEDYLLFLFEGKRMMPLSNKPPTRKMLGNIAKWAMEEHDKLLEEEKQAEKDLEDEM